jgi:hypothetical protein
LRFDETAHGKSLFAKDDRTLEANALERQSGFRASARDMRFAGLTGWGAGGMFAAPSAPRTGGTPVSRDDRDLFTIAQDQ